MPQRFPRTTGRPHFFWQGALIVLPALVLAGTGLYSLRQDDVLARHEAAGQAQTIATELAQHVVPQALYIELPAVPAIPPAAAVPDDELIERLKRSALVGSACLVDLEGRLLYPPPVAPLPVPQPLDPGELNLVQQDAWLRNEAAWRGEAAPASSFPEDELPGRFAAVARFRSAMALARAGQPTEAAQRLRPLADLAPDVVSETGIPLRWLAAWQMATLRPDDTGHVDVVNSLCRQLLAEPSPVSEILLERIAALGPAARRWAEVSKSHQDARRLHARLTVDPEATSVFLDGVEHWPRHQAVEGGRWLVAVPVPELAAAVNRLDRSTIRPVHFGVAVTVGPHRVLERPAAIPALAQGASDPPGVRVDVFLRDPTAFAAQRRARTLRFAALIAASAGAVVIGFFAAWRAFRRQQQLSEMKSNFVSSVSHELRAPIASVRLMAEELERGETPDPGKLRQYLRFIRQECRRLSAVIENVLDFSRREQGREQFEFEPVDLGSLVDETVALMRTHGLDRGVLIETTHLGSPQPVEADGRALQRLLVNLIDNALKHAPDSSTVTVGLEFGTDRVSLWVEDRGPGIPRVEHDRIFDRFYRVGSELRRQTQGVGLGLSIVKHLAEVHGGRVLVRSEPGQGSRFTVELPLAPASVPQPEKLPA